MTEKSPKEGGSFVEKGDSFGQADSEVLVGKQVELSRRQMNIYLRWWKGRSWQRSLPLTFAGPGARVHIPGPKYLKVINQTDLFLNKIHRLPLP